MKCWGYNGDGQLGDNERTSRFLPQAVAGISDAVAIASGARYSCALLRDGAIKCWGDAGYGTTDASLLNDKARLCSKLSLQGAGMAVCACNAQLMWQEERKPDLDEKCREWCSNGAGGAFCDCSSLPPLRSGQDFDAQERCKQWCASGEGGAFCDCSLLSSLKDDGFDEDEKCKEWCPNGLGGAFCDCSSLPPLRAAKDFGVQAPCPGCEDWCNNRSR